MSISKPTARRALGREVGGYGVFTATSGSTTTIACPAAFQSSELETDSLAYMWAFVPDGIAPFQHRVTALGLTIGSGLMTLESALGSAVGLGTVFELSGKLPPTHEHLVGTGGNALGNSLDGCVNLALRSLLIPDDQHSIPLVHNQRDYVLPAWLTKDAQLQDVRVLDALGGGYVSTHHRFEMREGARGATLHFANPYRFTSGSYAMQLVTRRPADTLVKRSGTWIDTTTGLVHESDECGVELRDLVPVALMFAYRALAIQSEGETADLYRELYREQRALCRGIAGFDDDRAQAAQAEAAPSAAAAAGVA